MKCIHCYISGRVQGVFFRASTQKQALSLGLSGWAKNLPDGRVEVLACGDQQALAQLRQWLRRGPSIAQVTHVECSELDTDNCPDGFSTA